VGQKPTKVCENNAYIIRLLGVLLYAQTHLTFPEGRGASAPLLPMPAGAHANWISYSAVYNIFCKRFTHIRVKPFTTPGDIVTLLHKVYHVGNIIILTHWLIFVWLRFVTVYRIDWCIDLFSCTAARVFNKLTYLLTYLLTWLPQCFI